MPSFFRAAAAAGLLLASPAAAQTPSVPHPYAYGILVGTNEGGAGQTPLRYAEEDARRMAQVLRELGRYGNTDLRVLTKPDSAKVLSALDEVSAKLRAHEARGEQAVFVFYYSGHAKANAFNLGSDELPIGLLRERLSKLPATLTLVVLDACQSGQFARVKGAEPAADFSFNSVSRLTTKGLAVMASSSAQELSQESDELRGSYFTHHLVTALRGAADVDGDGRVSLDEAYRYAYRRTLASTSETQVGGQHVTLETDLGGQGDVPVTYPAAAKSQLELPGALDARVIVQHRTSGSIVAEVQKAKGAPLKLAFPAGAYEALVRRGSPVEVLKCKLSLVDDRVTPLDTSGCEKVKAIGTGKGVDADALREPRRPVEPWAIESGIGFILRTEDDFTRRLQEFGYEAERPFIGTKRPRARFHLGFSKGITPHIALGAQVHTLAGDTYLRNAGDSADSFTWDAYGLSGFVRASSPRIGSTYQYAELYGQLQLGVSLGIATLETGSQSGAVPRESTTDLHLGYVVGGFGGVNTSLGRFVALFLQGGYEYAPTISNLVGDTHNSGGPSFQLGLRFRFQ